MRRTLKKGRSMLRPRGRRRGEWAVVGVVCHMTCGCGHREELKELRKQMGDIEKSLMQQVVTNEKRAEEALVSHTHRPHLL